MAAFLQGENFLTAAQKAFGVKRLTSVQVRVAASMVRKIQEAILVRHRPVPEFEPTPDPRIANLHEHGTAAGKVRYVGG
jgi:hypothetical protein